ncbi:hypothetical protein GJ496_009923, partial [Pomphorhynchus laevis]
CGAQVAVIITVTAVTILLSKLEYAAVSDRT